MSSLFVQNLSTTEKNDSLYIRQAWRKCILKNSSIIQKHKESKCFFHRSKDIVVVFPADFYVRMNPCTFQELHFMLNVFGLIARCMRQQILPYGHCKNWNALQIYICGLVCEKKPKMFFLYKPNISQTWQLVTQKCNHYHLSSRCYWCWANKIHDFKFSTLHFTKEKTLTYDADFCYILSIY